MGDVSKTNDEKSKVTTEEHVLHVNDGKSSHHLDHVVLNSIDVALVEP